MLRPRPSCPLRGVAAGQRSEDGQDVGSGVVASVRSEVDRIVECSEPGLKSSYGACLRSACGPAGKVWAAWATQSGSAQGMKLVLQLAVPA